MYISKKNNNGLLIDGFENCCVTLSHVNKYISLLSSYNQGCKQYNDIILNNDNIFIHALNDNESLLESNLLVVIISR